MKIKASCLRIALGLLLAIVLTACGGQPSTPVYPNDPFEFFPALNDHPESYRPGGGGGGSAEMHEMGFDLVTDLPIDEVHDFYAHQLEAAGWVYLSNEFEEGHDISYWELHTENDQTWPAILEITAKPVSMEGGFTVEFRAVLPP